MTADGVKLKVEPAAGGETSTIDADIVLVSTGRRPFTKNVGLEALGIETDKVGRIRRKGRHAVHNQRGRGTIGGHRRANDAGEIRSR